ncbi:signal peptidase II [Legionella sp. W05-934-2]|uniref:signal peptidase II n=1 Tax=Legionella sp. W05-934-2 TaxID=1198649 RepID=UPI0034626C37
MSRWQPLLVLFLVIFFDQLTKYWALTSLTPYNSVPVIPMLSWMLAFNTGAAFSFLSGAGDWHRWFFTGFSLTMCTVLFIWMWRTALKARWQAMSLAMIIGGAFSNVIDRFIHGAVVDFILVYYKNYHWPVFNIADSAICIGAFLLFFTLK